VLRVLESISDVPKEAWDALLDDAALPFLEWTWLEAFEETGCVGPRTGWVPRHLTLWDGGELVAAAPAYEKTGSHGEFVFDWDWANAAEEVGVRYYPKLLLAVPMTPATGRRVLVRAGLDRARLVRELLLGAVELAKASGLSSVHVLFPTEDEAAAMQDVGFAIRTGMQFHWQNDGYRTYDDFLARFHSKRRNQLKRERRAAAEQGIEIRTRRGADTGAVDADVVFRLYASNVDRHLYGGRYLDPAFFRRVLERFAHRVELVEARRAGRVVAGAFNVASPSRLYGRYWGSFEEHPFLHFHVCLYHSIDESIARGVRSFEGGAGGRHKVGRGFAPALTRSAHMVFHPVLDRAVRDFCRREARMVEASLPTWRERTGMKPAP
jgi:hypothetical protein